MARVIPFPPIAKPRDEVIAYYERLLNRAKLGEIQGALTVLSVADSDDEMTMCGVFADDLSYVTTTARVAFECLLGQESKNIETAASESQEKHA